MKSDTRKLSVGIGSSETADATQAGREAATTATAALGQEPVALVLVYASVCYDLPALLAGIREVTGDARLAGATSNGQFHQGQLTPPGRGVTVVTLSAGPYRFGVASAGGLRADAFSAGRTVARAARDAAGPDRLSHAALILLCEGLADSQQALLNGVYRVAGAAVPVVGGAAGDDRRTTRTSVFHDDQVLDDAAVGVWIDSDRPLTVTAGHGWQSRGVPMMVTQLDGTAVRTLAGRPATTVFHEHIDPANTNGDMVPITEGGWYSAHALGLIEPDGALLIRSVYVDHEHVLRTFVPLPAYSAIQVMSSRADDLLAVSDQIAADLLDDRDASVLLAFSCVARLDILGDRAAEEPARLQVAAGEVPTVGFYTYGEFARTTSVAGYHNATITAIAL